jgi:hypothetical protein
MKYLRDAIRPVLGILLMMSCVVIFLTAEPGIVGITEFSPDTLGFRSRQYFCYSFLGSATEWSLPLAERVRDFDDDVVPPQSPPRWHFVHGDKWRTRGWNGNAKVAYRLFRNEHWIDWTEKNPELAKRLWPRAIHLLRQERYRQVQTVLEFARDAKTLEDIDHAFAEAEKE